MPQLARNHKDFIGLGLYAPAEAARYARVKTSKLSRWIFGTGVDEPVIASQLDVSERIVTFLDFAQSLSVHEIRLASNISLQKIRDAYREAQQEHGIQYPFAMKHGIFVFGNLRRPDRCELGIFVPNPGDSPALQKKGQKEYIEKRSKAVQLTGRHKRNLLIGEIIRDFSQNLIFDEGSGLAEEYVAYEGHGHRILMDRNVRFGKPYLEHIGYEAETLADAVRIEKTIERAAMIYDVAESAVRAALEYYKLLRTDPPKHRPRPLAA